MPVTLDTAVALVTLQEAKDALKISGAAEDDRVMEMVNRASSFANRYVGRTLVETDYTEYYDGDGCGELMLKNYPVTELTSVRDDVVRAFTDAAIDAANMILDAESGVIRLWNTPLIFNKGIANVKVVYSAGYVATAVPHDLREAVLMIVQHHYKRIYQDQRIGLVSETIGERTMTYSEEAIPKKAREILNHYKLIHTGSHGHA